MISRSRQLPGWPSADHRHMCKPSKNYPNTARWAEPQYSGAMPLKCGGGSVTRDYSGNRKLILRAHECLKFLLPKEAREYFTLLRTILGSDRGKDWIKNGSLKLQRWGWGIRSHLDFLQNYLVLTMGFKEYLYLLCGSIFPLDQVDAKARLA